MVIIFLVPALLIICAIFFCIKDWYEHSFKEFDDRKHLVDKSMRVVMFLPLVLQGAFLFCYALAQSFALAYSLSYFIDSNILKNETFDPGIFDPLKIIYFGSILLALQYLLSNAKLFEAKGPLILTKAIIFLGSIFLLQNLLVNMLQSVSLGNSTAPVISYSNDLIWILCFLLVMTLTIIKGSWIYNRDLYSLQRLALTSRILICYTLFIIVIALPMIIHSVITYLLGDTP